MGQVATRNDVAPPEDREVAPPQGKSNLPATKQDTASLNEMLQARGMSREQFHVLKTVIFPTAKTTTAIFLAVDYCKVRGLDIMKRPVNIVSTYINGEEVETVWPSINEHRITAQRTGQHGGSDECEFGPAITETMQITQWENKKEVVVNIEVTYPEWAKFTVYRWNPNIGKNVPHPAKIRWKELYKRAKKSFDGPNERWRTAPYAQAEKCAEAASLRRGFPEECSSPTAEEMDGAVLAEEPETTPVSAAKALRNTHANKVDKRAQEIAESAVAAQVPASEEVHDVEYADSGEESESAEEEHAPPPPVKPTQQERFQAEAELAREAGRPNEFLDELAKPGISSGNATALMKLGREKGWEVKDVITEASRRFELESKKWDKQITERQRLQLCDVVASKTPAEVKAEVEAAK